MAEQEPREGAADRAPRGRSSERPPRARDASASRSFSGRRSDDRAQGSRDGDRKPYEKRDGDRKPYPKRDGDRKPYGNRDGDRKPYGNRDGDRKPYERRDGDRKPYGNRDGDRRPYGNRDGDRKPYEKRDGDRKPYEKRDGDRKPYEKRDGDRKPYEKRDGDRKPYGNRDGDRKPYERRDGDRKPYATRDGNRKPYEKREGDRADRPNRGGAGRPDTALRPEQNRPVRARHDDPIIPEEVTAHDLHPSARNELKTLSKENAEQVARHLAMASQLIDEDPELAHQHALSASRKAGRIAIVRETLAITAYATGDYALALRELRTYRRISGKDDQIALMVDSERGVGRPDRALELGRSIDRSTLPTDVRVELAIAMSGARLDQGDAERALLELDIPELDPDRAFEWSPALFAARATVLEELGRHDEAARWHQRALVAAEAIDAASGIDDLETVFVDEVLEEEDEADAPAGDEAAEEESADDSEPAGEEPVEKDSAHDREPAGEEPVDDDSADASDHADVGDAASDAQPSVHDEVAEILSDAGIDDDDADGPEGADR